MLRNGLSSKKSIARFEYTVADVRKALLEVAGKVQGVLQEPKPYVWMTNSKLRS